MTNTRFTESRNKREGWYATIYTITVKNGRAFYRRRKGRTRQRNASFKDFQNIRLYKARKDQP